MIREIEKAIEEILDNGLKFTYFNGKKVTKEDLYSLLYKEKNKPEQFKVVADFSDKFDKSIFRKRKKRNLVLCFFDTIQEDDGFENTWSFYLNFN